MGLQSAADDVTVYRLISVLGSKRLTSPPPPQKKIFNNIKSMLHYLKQITVAELQIL